MHTVNIPKVKGKMAERGYNNTSFAKALNISRNTLSHYMEDPDSIPYGVLHRMASLLCDDESEVVRIFFADKLTQNAS